MPPFPAPNAQRPSLTIYKAIAVTNNQDFAEFVLGHVDPTQPFVPGGYYIEEGDCFEFFVSDAPFTGEDRVDEFLTLYRDQNTKHVTGGLIKGLGKAMQRLIEKPGIRVEIQRDEISLEMIFALRQFESITDLESRLYKEAREAVQAVHHSLTVPLCGTR
jgi:hypothetical protein